MSQPFTTGSVLTSARLDASIGDAHRKRSLLQSLVLLYAAIGGMLLSLFSRDYLPAKMLNDDGTMQDFIHGRIANNGETKYGATANMFIALGLGDAPIAVSIIAILMTLGTVLLAMRLVGTFNRSWLAIGISVASLLLAGIYLGLYSKEFFVIPLIALFLALPGGWRTDLLWIAVAVLYAVAVREYWFLVVALYVALRVLFARTRRLGWLLLGWAGLLLGVVVAFNVVLGTSATFFRTSTNDKLVIDRASEIQDPIAGNAIPIQFLNVVVVVMLLLIPIALLLAGSITHIISAVALGVLWISIFLSLGRYSSTAQARDVQFERSIALLLAFVSVQSFFEPDYGSYLRHLIPLFPLALVVVGRAALVARSARHRSAGRTAGA